MREAQQPQEFSVSRLAKRWNLEHGFIAGEIKEGRLAARRIGGRHLRVHFDEVRRYERDYAVAAIRPSA